MSQSWADLGANEDRCDPESKFTLVHEARAAARRAYVHLDCSKRVQRALLRNARTLPGEYQIGDVVCFRRDNQKGPVWSPASRVTGKEAEDKVWVLYTGLPVQASPQNMRPAQDAEALAFSFLNDENFEAVVGPQQGFEDATPTLPEPTNEKMGPDGDMLGTLLGDNPTIPEEGTLTLFTERCGWCTRHIS